MRRVVFAEVVFELLEGTPPGFRAELPHEEDGTEVDDGENCEGERGSGRRDEYLILPLGESRPVPAPPQARRRRRNY
jgi:hypothetical protein